MKFLELFESKINQRKPRSNKQVKKESIFENILSTEKPKTSDYYLENDSLERYKKELEEYNKDKEINSANSYFDENEDPIQEPIQENEINYFLDDNTECQFKVSSDQYSDVETDYDYFLDQPINEDNKTDVKELEKEIEDVSIKDIKNNTENAQSVYEKLIELLSNKPYEEAVNFIDDIVKDPKLKFLLSLGFGGEFADLKLTLKKVNITAKRLIPTQNEIGLDETLKYLMKGNNIEKCFENPCMIKHPIVTFQGTFIIDGHHRWSEIFATNPNANLECINIEGDLSPLSMLKAVQATIGSNLGNLIIKDVQGKNLFKCKENDFRKYLKETPKETVEKLSKYYEDPIEQIIENCLQMKINNTPILNAPKRGDMPQTSKDPDLFNDLKNGVSDI